MIGERLARGTNIHIQTVPPPRSKKTRQCNKSIASQLKGSRKFRSVNAHLLSRLPNVNIINQDPTRTRAAVTYPLADDRPREDECDVDGILAHEQAHCRVQHTPRSSLHDACLIACNAPLVNQHCGLR